MKYEFSSIEPKWQAFWEKNKTFKTSEDLSKPKYYVLDMFPYPSGEGLHVGHPEGYTATDIVTRYKRMNGFNVLHPMGWDAFGLPAERYAMQTKIHPAVTTQKNINNFRRQLKNIGFAYDWEREVNTTEPGYYKWTQWIFLKIFNSWYDTELKKARPISELPIPAALQAATQKNEREEYINSKRLAYIAEIPVNWCAGLGTVLANEEVDEWVSKGYTVERKPMRQWMMRITAYADRLLEDLQYVEWPEGTLELQKNWIGRSEGALVRFALGQSYTVSVGGKTQELKDLEVYTTRPDTLLGSTYLVIAPEHPLVSVLTTPEQQTQVAKYCDQAKLKTDLDRTVEGEKAEKTGVFSGGYALHPITGQKIPVWIADYVLMGYGTGAIMAVPGHDVRDHEFAKKFKLPIQTVVVPAELKTASAAQWSELTASEAFTHSGFSVNSQFLDGLSTAEAKQKIIAELEKPQKGHKRIQYKLRDWVFSRQRYWGEPMPISFKADGTMVTEAEANLPLCLPESDDFQPAPSGESPLAKLTHWVEHSSAEHGLLKRETNTMPQWAGSCWYYLRFADNQNSQALIDPKKEKYWLGDTGVDLYVGGAEHAVLHLLYARFWHKVLYDYGVVSAPEPFKKLVHQGLILGEDGSKMSKSRGNVVNPDEVVKQFGADSLRLYEMFLGPLEASKPWSAKGIEGVHRFLGKTWRIIFPETGAAANEGQVQAPRALANGLPTEEINRLLHKTIKKVSEDIEGMRFNTAISTLMVFCNEFSRVPEKSKQVFEAYLIMLSTFAPHIAEELWSHLGHKESISLQPWPKFDPQLCQDQICTIVVQVSGKMRGKLECPMGISESEAMAQAMALENVSKFIEGKKVVKQIFVPNKLVNIVVV